MQRLLLASLFIFSITVPAQVNLTSNIKVCMPFNGNANDISGNGNNGSVSGAALTTDRFGNPNKAYAFNGTSDYIAINSFASLAPTNELTISMWAKASITTSNCLFEIISDSPSDRCVGCAQYSNAGNTMMLWDYGSIYSGGRTTQTNIPIDNSGWHHYVYIISQSGNLKQMYLDGSNVSNAAYSLTCVNKNKPFYIGSASDTTGGDLRFHGSIDDVCIYNRALNASEVSALYSGAGACFTVGMEELRGFEKIMVYPTVSNGIYNVINAKAADQLIEVYSMDGKLIRSYDASDPGIPGSAIDISTAENGMYILKVTGKESAFTQKLIKN